MHHTYGMHTSHLLSQSAPSIAGLTLSVGSTQILLTELFIRVLSVEGVSAIANDSDRLTDCGGIVSVGD